MRGRMFVLKTLNEDRQLREMLCRSPKYLQLVNAKPLQDYLLSDTTIKDGSIDAEIRADASRLQSILATLDDARSAVELDRELAAVKRKLHALLQLCPAETLRAFIEAQQ